VDEPRNSSSELGSFDLLLEQLDSDRNRAGEKYEVVRRKLIKYFGWNDCFPEEDLADVTFDRVMSRLADGHVHNVEAFIWGVAKNVAREFRKKPPSATLEESLQSGQRRNEGIEMDVIAAQERQRRLECLHSCMQGLPPGDRELFLAYQYYVGKGRNTKALAKERGVAVNTLQIQAYRLKHKVVRCVLRCLDARTSGMSKC
jgi:DNA-directed RNA polymerase specialized sigma24 family protein